MAFSEENKNEKKAHIIESAAKVFAKKGFSGTVVADIATEAGIGKGTVYEYFNSKDDLFFAVFEWFSQKTAAAAVVKFSALTGSTSERLKAMEESIINVVTEAKELYSLSMEFWAASASSKMRERFKEAFRQNYAEFRDIISSLIQEGIERGEFRSDLDPDSLAAVLIGAWDAIGLQAWFDDSFDLMAASKNFMTCIISGMTAKPSYSVN